VRLVPRCGAHLPQVAVDLSARQFHTGDVVEQHREQSPAPPRTHNSALPEQLEQIILRCLAKDPSQRFGSCRELGRALTTLRGR
jgi:hypothetical protein